MFFFKILDGSYMLQCYVLGMPFQEGAPLGQALALLDSTYPVLKTFFFHISSRHFICPATKGRIRSLHLRIMS
jgi:hypothetical protein